MMDERVLDFFGKRNGIEIDPKLGVNYDVLDDSNETYENVNNLVEHAIETLDTEIINVYVYGGGIGLTSLGFLDNERINHVYIWEEDETMYKKLETNLSIYEFSPKRYSLYNNYFDPAENHENVILIIDQTKISDPVGKHTLDGWINRTYGVELVIIKTTKPYVFDNLWNCVKTFNDKIYTNICTKGAVYENLDEGRTKKIQGTMYKIFISITNDSEMSKQLVIGDSLSFWLSAFTNEDSMDKSMRNNNEYEYSGKMLYDCVLVKYLMRRYGKSDANDNEIKLRDLKSLHEKYSSKQFKRDIGKAFGIDSIIKSLTPNITDKFVDSMFGAMSDLVDTHIGDGIGQVMCYNLITFLMNIELN